jgi:hypothetical protein
MARGSQTHMKRQREIKLREKAQQKRDRRGQRQTEKKQAKERGDLPLDDQLMAGDMEAAGFMEPILDAATIDAIVAREVGGLDNPSESTSDQASSQNGRPNGGNVPSKLFVGNLAHTVTDGDLADFVTNAGFQAASAVVIRDKMTGEPRGFGFVELADGSDLQQAIQGLNGQVLQDRRLTVNEARPQQRNGFSGPRGGSNFGGGGRGGFGRRY